MSGLVNVESELEEEIRLELERLEQIFNEETNIESTTKVKPNRVSYSAYEYAEAEGEKEELEDQLRSLVSKTDDYSAKIQHLSMANADLQQINEQLQIENARLRSVTGGGNRPGDAANLSNIGFESYSVLSPGSIALEHLLAETRTKLLQAESAYQDLLKVRDASLQELDRERALRIHAGKMPFFVINFSLRLFSYRTRTCRSRTPRREGAGRVQRSLRSLPAALREVDQSPSVADPANYICEFYVFL